MGRVIRPPRASFGTRPGTFAGILYNAEIALFRLLEYIPLLRGLMEDFGYDELFHEAGPAEALDYLWGRLQDRDLSQDEALALLGAVHHALSAQRAADRGIYFAYTRFMESLSREMPVVHDYVVACWIESRRGARRASGQAGDHAPVAGAAPGVGQAGPGPAQKKTGEGNEPSPVKE